MPRPVKVLGYDLLVNHDGTVLLDRTVKLPSESDARRIAKLWRAAERAESRAESRAAAKFERWAHG